ncbi:MAG: cupin domain-containing protein [Zavarzinia sp.]|nr:cupin domain-containing protein [Zavarzinia sp.]
MRKGPVVSLDSLPLETMHDGPVFAARAAAVLAPMGARHLGGRLIEVPPGKRAWPRHCHHANDEVFVILAGTGTLRQGGDSYPVAAGDVVVCPAGGVEGAHQLINDGTVPLRYLALSSMREPDVLEYPDSAKFAVFAGSAPGGDPGARRFTFIGRRDGEANYWDGEE